jgi:hypothetical protein
MDGSSSVFVGIDVFEDRLDVQPALGASGRFLE